MICEVHHAPFQSQPVCKSPRAPSTRAMQPGAPPPGGAAGFDYSYQQQQYSQQPAPSSSGSIGGPIPSMRPTLEIPAGEYYQQPPQPLLPSVPQQYHHHLTQQSPYYGTHTPVASSSAAVAPQLQPLQYHAHQYPSESKPVFPQQLAGTDYRHHLQPELEPPPQSQYPQERGCDLCQHPDPVLVAPACGHTFHSRCVHVWPLDVCPVCGGPVDALALSRSVNMSARPDPRSGKWTRAEEKFIETILREFDRQALPLAHGTPVRLVLAKLLNCSTMRLSKKFQKNALGKRTFRVTKPVRGEKALRFDAEDHVRRQREFSELEDAFRRELVDQFRRENNTDEGALVETQDLSCAVKQFWVSNFLKFAVLVGQPVVGLDVSDSKKRKLALQLMRNGQYDELLSWHHPSPANTTSVSPMPPLGSSTPIAAVQASTASAWSAGGSMYSSSSLGQVRHESGATIQQMLQQVDRPVKKMRTPDGGVDASRFGLQPSLMDTSYHHYGKLPSPATQYDYAQQQQQQQQQYPSGPYSRQPATATYSSYGLMKQEKVESGGYPSILQQQQQQQQLTPPMGEYSSQAHGQPSSGLAPGSFPRPSNPGGAYHPGAGGSVVGQSHQQAPSPWDDMLENMSASAAPAAQAPAPAPGGSDTATSQGNTAPQSGDPSLQAWSSLHIL